MKKRVLYVVTLLFFCLGSAVTIQGKTTTIDIQGNGLKGEYEFGTLKKLRELDVRNNYISKLNLCGCNKLFKVSCYNNDLKVLDMRDCERTGDCDITENPNVEIYVNIRAMSYDESYQWFTYDATAMVHRLRVKGA